MRVLVTVGSTKFDALVGAALSQPVLGALSHKGYTDLVVQRGNSQVDEFDSKDVERNVHRHGLNIDVWTFKPNLDEEYDAADLVIGHAGLCSPLSHFLFFFLARHDTAHNLGNCLGSGTILDVLRRGKPLIIVPNPTLLDNHQEDMAHAMGLLGHAKVSTAR
jgi:beta-1,4-N-acetylglucosaminyltransferase